MKRNWLIWILAFFLITGCTSTTKQPNDIANQPGALGRCIHKDMKEMIRQQYQLEWERGNAPVSQLQASGLQALAEYLQNEGLESLIGKPVDKVYVECSHRDRNEFISIRWKGFNALDEDRIWISKDEEGNRDFDYSINQQADAILNYQKNGREKQAYLLLEDEEDGILCTIDQIYLIHVDSSTKKITGKNYREYEEFGYTLHPLKFVESLQNAILLEFQNYASSYITQEELANRKKVLEEKLIEIIQKNENQISRSKAKDETLYYPVKVYKENDEIDYFYFRNLKITEGYQENKSVIENRILRTLYVVEENKADFNTTDELVITKEIRCYLASLSPYYYDCDPGLCRYEKDVDGTEKADKEKTLRVPDDIQLPEGMFGYVTWEDYQQTADIVLNRTMEIDDMFTEWFLGVNFFPQHQLFVLNFTGGEPYIEQYNFLLLDDYQIDGNRITVQAFLIRYFMVEDKYFVAGKDDQIYWVKDCNMKNAIQKYHDQFEKWEFILEDIGNPLYRIVSGIKTN